MSQKIRVEEISSYAAYAPEDCGYGSIRGRNLGVSIVPPTQSTEAMCNLQNRCPKNSQHVTEFGTNRVSLRVIKHNNDLRLRQSSKLLSCV